MRAFRGETSDVDERLAEIREVVHGATDPQYAQMLAMMEAMLALVRGNSAAAVAAVPVDLDDPTYGSFVYATAGHAALWIRDVDAAGNPGFFTESIGRGRVVVYRDGHSIDGYWTRRHIGSGTTLVDKHGLDHADPLPYLELVVASPMPRKVTLARKIVSLTLRLWKKGESWDPKQLTMQAT